MKNSNQEALSSDRSWWRGRSSGKDSKKIELSPLKEKLAALVRAMAQDLVTTHPDLIPKFLLRKLTDKKIPEILAKLSDADIRDVLMGARSFLDELIADPPAVVEGEIVTPAQLPPGRPAPPAPPPPPARPALQIGAH